MSSTTTPDNGTPAWGTRRGPTVPYIPGLDGLRALAVIAVIVYHADSRWLGGGFLGVEVFFVISGYLITLLLVAERERTGTVTLPNFWMRRARRLLPALWLLLVLLVLVLIVVPPPFFHVRVISTTGGVPLACSALAATKTV